MNLSLIYKHSIFKLVLTIMSF